VLWTRWPEEEPHRVLTAGDGRPIIHLDCISVPGRTPFVLAVTDCQWHIWDPVTGQQLAAHRIGRVRLAGAATVAAADGKILLATVDLAWTMRVHDVESGTAYYRVRLGYPWRLLQGWVSQLLIYEAAGVFNSAPAVICALLADGTGVAVTVRSLRRPRGSMTVSIWDLGTGNLRVEASTGAPDASWVREKASLPSTVSCGRMRDGRTTAILSHANFDNPDAGSLAYLLDLDSGTWLTSEALSAGSPGESGSWRPFNTGELLVRPEQDRDFGSGPDPRPLMIYPERPEEHHSPARGGASENWPGIRCLGDTVRAEVPGSPGRFRTLAGHLGRVTGAGWLKMPDGNPAIVSGSQDSTIRIWNVNAGYSQPQHEAPPSGVQAFDALQHSDGRILGATAEDADQDDGPRIRFWDFTDSRPFTDVSLPEPVSALTCLSLADGTSAVVAYGSDYMMRAWDLTTGSALFESGADPDSWAHTIAGCQLAGGESLLVTSGHNSAVAALWDASTGHRKQWLRGHTGWVSCAACGSYQGQPVAVTGGYDCRICVWGLPGGELRRSFRALPSWSRIFPVFLRFESIALCEIGDHLPALITRDQLGAIRIWDVRNGRYLATITDATVSTLHFDCLPVSRDRALVVTADADACMRVWLLSSQHRQRQDPACEVRLLDRIDIESRILGLRLNPNLTVILNTRLGLAAIHLDLDVLLAGSGQDHPPGQQRAARRPATPAASA
jgi:WD40 repeat protein